MMKFIVALGTGITLIIFGVLAVGLGFLHDAALLIVTGLGCFTIGIACIWVASLQLLKPDFLLGMIVGAHKKGKWTNALCPSCLWWMKTAFQDFPGHPHVQVWFCVNPDHADTFPGGS